MRRALLGSARLLPPVTQATLEWSAAHLSTVGNAAADSTPPRTPPTVIASRDIGAA